MLARYAICIAVALCLGAPSPASDNDDSTLNGPPQPQQSCPGSTSSGSDWVHGANDIWWNTKTGQVIFDPAVQDTSVTTIAVPLMAGVALGKLPGLVAGLSAPAVSAAAAGGATVIGTPPALAIDVAIKVLNYVSPTIAANFVFDFTDPQSASASSGVLLQFAMNALNQFYNSGVVPPFDLEDGTAWTMQTVEWAYNALQLYYLTGAGPLSGPLGAAPTPPTNNSTVSTADTADMLADAMVQEEAEETMDAGGSADTGGGSGCT